jgi:U3 small nucleolar RNA-associated protein 3
MEERRKFEEDRFVRLTLSKKDKKAMKKRREMTFNPSQELVADMGDIGDFESLAALTSNLQSVEPSSSTASVSRLKANASLNSESLSNALKKAVNVFSEEGKGTKKAKRGADEEDFSAGIKKTSRRQQVAADDFGGDSDDFEELPEPKASKRRRAPEPEEDESNIFNEFSKKKKEFLNRKQDHYAVEQRTGGHEEVIEDPSDKRAATYEIMTNRGLRPHRKKSNRNPRVKKREAFDKAVQKRKSQVREVTAGSTVAYGGEMTGIKAHLSRSRRFAS